MRMTVDQLRDLITHAIKRGDELVEIHPTILERLVYVATQAKICVSDHDLQCEDSNRTLEILELAVQKLESDL